MKGLEVSKKTQERTLETINDTMPNVVDYLEGLYERAYVEGQDLVQLFTGRTGYGKSNTAAVITIGSLPLIKDVTGKKQKFNFATNAGWSGMDFLLLLKPIALEVVGRLMEEEDPIKVYNSLEGADFFKNILNMISPENIDKLTGRLKKLKRKHAYKQFWLDEAQDLNAQESQNLFNKEMVKIFSGIREMNLIFNLCIPSPFLLNNYIREERINTMFFPYPVPDGGSKRFARQVAVYDLSRYYPILHYNSMFVRRLMISPLQFINKFRPTLIGQTVPLFPEDSIEWKTYKVMKMLSTVRIPLKSVKKIEEKRDKKNSKGHTDPIEKTMKRLGYIQ